MRMNHIVPFGACNDSRHDRIIINFLQQVIGVTTGKLKTSQIVDMPVTEIGVDMIAQLFYVKKFTLS